MVTEGLLADAQREIAGLRAALNAVSDEARSSRASLERALSDTLGAVYAGFWELDLRTGAASWSDGA